MRHFRVVYETTAGSYSKVTELEEFRTQAVSACYISESCDNSTIVHCSFFCDLTPHALGFVISSCLDLLIGSPQAALALETLSLGDPKSADHNFSFIYYTSK